MKILGLVIAIMGSITLGACSSDYLLSTTAPTVQSGQFQPIQ